MQAAKDANTDPKSANTKLDEIKPKFTPDFILSTALIALVFRISLTF